MFRFSDGLTFTGSTEKAISYLIFQAKELDNNPFESPIWSYWGEKPLGTRLYKSKFYGRLQIFKKPLNDNKRKVLFDALDSLVTKKKHPALENNLMGELQRLFPLAEKNVEEQYQHFITFLIQTFGLDEYLKTERNLMPYADDIGPFMLGSIGDRDFVVPELPCLYLAPHSWRDITWIVNNYFSGPYQKSEKHKIKDHFHWCNVKIDPKYNTQIHEGIAYFIIAKFIIIYEAYSENTACSNLKLYFDLIQNQQIKPWKQLF